MEIRRGSIAWEYFDGLLPGEGKSAWVRLKNGYCGIAFAVYTHTGIRRFEPLQLFDPSDEHSVSPSEALALKCMDEKLCEDCVGMAIHSSLRGGVDCELDSEPGVIIYLEPMRPTLIGCERSNCRSHVRGNGCGQ